MTFCIFRQLLRFSGHASSFRHPPFLRNKILGIFLEINVISTTWKEQLMHILFVAPNAKIVLILEIFDLNLNLLKPGLISKLDNATLILKLVKSIVRRCWINQLLDKRVKMFSTMLLEPC